MTKHRRQGHSPYLSRLKSRDEKANRPGSLSEGRFANTLAAIQDFRRDIFPPRASDWLASGGTSSRPT